MSLSPSTQALLARPKPQRKAQRSRKLPRPTEPAACQPREDDGDDDDDANFFSADEQSPAPLSAKKTVAPGSVSKALVSELSRTLAARETRASSTPRAATTPKAPATPKGVGTQANANPLALAAAEMAEHLENVMA